MKIPDKIDLKSIPLPSSEELAGDVAKLSSTDATEPQKSEQGSTEVVLQRAIIANANQVWRAFSAVFEDEGATIREEMSAQEIRKVAKAIESMKETLTSLGIRIVDRLGEPFNAGLPEQVVTEEPREGLSREQIIRTIRPTIFWNQTMVQRGEIDIAVPSENTQSESKDEQKHN